MTRQSDVPIRLKRPQGRINPYDKIRAAILDGQIAPGSGLVEAALAEWCEVSRTPVREALGRLVQDGLVVRSSRGLVVRERSPQEILDIYETRIVLEGTAARMAALRRTDVDLFTIKRAAAAFETERGEGAESLTQRNHRFHESIWHASHNDSLVDLLRRLETYLARYPSTTLVWPGRWEQAVEEHAALVAAVEAGDGAEAEKLNAIHFTHARTIRLTIFAEEGGESS